MMGHEKQNQGQLFYTRFNLERRVRKNHLLRRIARYIALIYVAWGRMWLVWLGDVLY
jgi:hypothetical protein